MGDRQLCPGPGKTAPRLISDLLDYDLRNPKTKERNLLAGDAPQFRGQAIIRKQYDDCRHVLLKKVERTNSPVSRDERASTSSKYVISTYCVYCLFHFDITVDFTKGNGGRNPCHISDKENPLHHLRLVNSSNADHKPNKFDEVLETRSWECSGANCPVIVHISICPPRVSTELLAPIMDWKQVDARGRRAIAEEPERFVGFGPISVQQTVSNLRTYLKDAKGEQDPNKLKKIAKRNKKLLLGFGDDCDPLFDHLGFKVVTDSADPLVEDPNYYWQLPLITDANKYFIDDAIYELETVIASIEERKGDPKVTHVGLPALPDIERSLGYYDYPTRSRTVDLEGEEHPYYASLGAVEQFTDDFLSWAYDRQCECDPARKPYYLDCLSDLATGRDSSDLQTKVVMATSAGAHGLKEIEEAYRFLGLESTTTEGDDHIIGVYSARIDSAPRQKDEARQCLKVVASARQSAKIEAVANDKSMTPSEAFEFLNVTEDTPSDSIQAAAVVMALDGDKGIVIRALKVISVHRKGDYALEAAAANLESGEEQTLSVSDAYKRLQIGDRNVPDEIVLTYYQSLSADAPAGSKDSYTEALRVIALDRTSTFLLMKLENPDADVQAVRTTSAEPVGLENIGNTCYLNSLLQFYYTIQAVRDVVINFEFYRVDPNDENISSGKKRVGGRVVNRAEVVKAQKFVDELHGLYENLRTASTRSVKPTKQLAKSTFITRSLEESFRESRKQSISSPNGPPPLSIILNGPIHGSEAPPTLQHGLLTPEEEKDIEMIDRPGEKSPKSEGDSSEATLIELDTDMDQPALADASQGDRLFPSTEKSEQGADAVMVNGYHPTTEPKYPAPPEKPPPVPPRNKAGLSIQTKEVKDTVAPEEDGFWQLGTQQDVTEVMGNVMTLLSCAIKPTGVTESGIQTDKVYDSFYGDSAVYTQKPSKLEKKVESWANLMVYPGDQGSRDIYEALDVNYDEQLVEIGKNQIPQYTSITKLPPILQIQIQRTAWNRGASAGSKNSNPVVFPETIYLDRYMDSDDPDSQLMKRRRQAWKWKSELRTLEARQAALQTSVVNMSVPDALRETHAWILALQEEEIEGIDVDPTVPDLLESRMEEVAHELELTSHRVGTIKRKLNDQFATMRKYEYKLQTVFIHRGEAGGGHYWIYLYDFENDVWREYNDEYVTVVTDRRRIFEHQGGGTPYYLAYVRSPDQKDLVNALVREVREPDISDATMSWADRMDEGIAMDQDNEGDMRHVENVNPRPILPKPGNHWIANGSVALDANGKPW